jgi:uncharacterized protein YyaL (SSP411 family)
MIFGYLEASFILGEPSAMEFAIKSLNRLLALNFRIGEGMYHFYDGQPQLKNQLSDQAQMTKTLCQAYQCTGNAEYLARAEELVEITSRTVYDSEHGGFFDTLVDLQAPGFLSKPAKPLEENSPAARALIILHNLTGKDKYRQLAEGTLKRFVEIYPQFSFMAAEYAIAADCFLNEPTTIQIIGSLETPQTKGLLTEAHRLYEPRKVIQFLDPQKDSGKIAALGYPVASQPSAYVCVGKACTAPIIEPRQIAPELDKMIATQLRK